MSCKAEVIRRVELIDQLSTILRDLRRSEMRSWRELRGRRRAKSGLRVLMIPG
jgi:hypothetical protein